MALLQHRQLLTCSSSAAPFCGLWCVKSLRDRLPGKRNGRAPQVLDWVDRGAEFLLETLARTYFRQAGTSVEAQVHIDGVGFVDLLLEGTLIVELEGRHHGEWIQVKKDQAGSWQPGTTDSVE